MIEVLELRFRGSLEAEGEDPFEPVEVQFSDAPTSTLLSWLAVYAASYMMNESPDMTSINRIYFRSSAGSTLAFAQLPGAITTWQFTAGMTYFWFRVTAPVTTAGTIAWIDVQSNVVDVSVFRHTLANPIPVTTDMTIALNMTVQVSFPSYTNIAGPPIQAFNPSLDLYGAILSYIFPSVTMTGGLLSFECLYGVGGVKASVTFNFTSFSSGTAVFGGSRSFTSTFIFSTFVLNDFCAGNSIFWASIPFADTVIVFTPLATVVLSQPVTLDPDVTHRFTIMFAFTSG
ncbi:MAG: hypothetical protein QXX12_00070 [Nanopusillaceae archaeon]